MAYKNRRVLPALLALSRDSAGTEKVEEMNGRFGFYNKNNDNKNTSH